MARPGQALRDVRRLRAARAHCLAMARPSLPRLLPTAWSPLAVGPIRPFGRRPDRSPTRRRSPLTCGGTQGGASDHRDRLRSARSRPRLRRTHCKSPCIGPVARGVALQCSWTLSASREEGMACHGRVGAQQLQAPLVQTCLLGHRHPTPYSPAQRSSRTLAPLVSMRLVESPSCSWHRTVEESRRTRAART
jgi:hypothetical protein